MTTLLTLTTAGSYSGPFDLYSNIDGFTTPFETDISRGLLVAGYSTSLTPDTTEIVRIQSKGDCVNYVDVVLTNLTTTTTTTAFIPVTGLTWSLIDNVTGVPTCQPAGWTVSNSNLTIRYDIADSENCGGTCTIVQTGTATANITVEGNNTLLNLDFEGLGEKEAADFELINFKLDGGTYSNVLLADAHAPGGGLGCVQGGPVVKTIFVPGPYLLEANTNYTFTIDFTTADNQYHIDCFYEVNLSFTEPTP